MIRYVLLRFPIKRDPSLLERVLLQSIRNNKSLGEYNRDCLQVRNRNALGLAHRETMSGRIFIRYKVSIEEITKIKTILSFLI